MRSPLTVSCSTFAVGWLLVFCSPVGASAQQAASSFEQFETRLKPGDTVYVIDRSGQETKGRIDLITAASLQLRLDGSRREIFKSDVARVERRSRDSVRNGLLIGLGAGAALGFFAGRSVDEGPCPPGHGCGEAELIGTVGGAVWGGLAGWITDALIRKREVVYLAP
jgi:hypothetical protein